MRLFKPVPFLAAVGGAIVLLTMQIRGESTQIPCIKITPAQALFDQNVEIELIGFPPKETVTVRVRALDDLARTWESHAEFLTDANGAANLTNQTPLSGGSYQKADVSGLFWSMSLPASEKTPSSFAWDGHKPITFEFTAQVKGHAVCSAKLNRIVAAPGVNAIRVHDGNLRGIYCIPPGSEPHPGLIVLGGSEGDVPGGAALFFASEGYATLALAYFRYDDLPKSLENIPVEYFESGIKWLEARKEVRSGGIGVVGGSRGGELALLLGSMFPQFKAVVAISPSGVIWGGLDATNEDSAQPAWTYHGQAIPFMADGELTADQNKRIDAIDDKDPFYETLVTRIILENRPAVEKAFIPVEKINGPVLLTSGSADQIWPSTMLADMIMARLKDAKHPFKDCHFDYTCVGHVIPQANFPLTTMDLAPGGDAEHTAAAAAAFWPRIIEFLNTAFAK